MNKLSHQLMILCTSLVVLTALAVAASFWWFSGRFTERYVDNSIEAATHIVSQYSNTNITILSRSALPLAKEISNALIEPDTNAVDAILKSFTQSINADIALVSKNNGSVISAHIKSSNKSLASDGSLAISQTNQTLQGLATRVLELISYSSGPVFVEVNSRIFELIFTPVNSKGVFYLVLGYELDAKAMQELKHLTGLDLTFYYEGKPISSSFNLLPDQAGAESHSKHSHIGLFQRDNYANHELFISTLESQNLSLVLSQSLQPINHIYHQLMASVLAVALIMTIIATIVALTYAKTLSIPLKQVVCNVQAIAKGHYNALRPGSRTSREIHSLMRAFSVMGKQIQSREAHIRYQAQHDLLTGLFNRDTLFQEIQTRISQRESFFLCALYVRDLQAINDKLGFDTGDNCLQIIAQRIREFLMLDDTVLGRVDGDLFVALIPGEETKYIERKVLDMHKQLQAPLNIQAVSLNMRFNTGISGFPIDGENSKILVRRAQIALDAAKKDNVAYRFYQSGEDEAHLERLAIVEDLKAALTLNDGQLFMHYQPKQHLNNGNVKKFEALIRWQRKDVGFVPPDIFIDLAERAGLIIELSYWVINSVFSQLKNWRDQGMDVQVAINISAQDLNHPDFFSQLQSYAKKYKIDTQRVTLELTERDLMSNIDQAVDRMYELRNAGYTLSVDDYGIGQSSLSKLRQLPIQELKIDKSFILQLDQSPTDQMIVRSTIELGHNLGIRVVAEGVENQASLQMLRDMKCDCIQGYFLARPMPADEVTPWLDEYKKLVLHG